LAALEAGLGLPVQGYEAPATLPADLGGCLDSGNFVPGTDILVIRRVQTSAPVQVASASPGQIYLQTTAYPSGPRYVLGDGADTSVFTLEEKKSDHSGAVVPAGLLPYRVHIYFVSPCDVPAAGDACDGVNDDNGRPVPTLKRLELTGDGAGSPIMSLVPLVEGVQNLQIDLDRQPDGRLSVGDGSPDRYVTLPAWRQVGQRRRSTTQPARRNTEDTGVTPTPKLRPRVSRYGGRSTAGQRHACSALARVSNVSSQRDISHAITPVERRRPVRGADRARGVHLWRSPAELQHEAAYRGTHAARTEVGAACSALEQCSTR
jgi:type IV pilus assembly protein PilW